MLTILGGNISKFMTTKSHPYITDRKNRKFNLTPKAWRSSLPIMVKKVGGNYKVLHSGTGRVSGKFQVTTHDLSGAFISRTGFKKGEVLMELGFETIFDQDFNGDLIKGSPDLVDKSPQDGLIDSDKWKYYRIFDVSQSHPFIVDNKGRRYNFTPKSWRASTIIKAVKSGSTYQVLHSGSGRLLGKYCVTTHDQSRIQLATTRLKWSINDGSWI